MEYFELIKKRHSVRGYKSEEVEKEKLDMILEAARLAPTAVNKQAFKIVVMSTKGHEEELKSIYNKNWFVEAPLVLGVCSNVEEAWTRRDGKSFSDVDASIVMDHIILAATALGLGTCWVGAFDLEAAKKVLGLGSSWEPLVFTPLGYAKDDNFKKVRKSIEDIVIYK